MLIDVCDTHLVQSNDPSNGVQERVDLLQRIVVETPLVLILRRALLLESVERDRSETLQRAQVLEQLDEDDLPLVSVNEIA